MPTLFKNAWGYKGDAMNLPVADVDAALSFYTNILGFEVESLSNSPLKSAILVRSGVKIGLVENGGDPEQDGCAFEVDEVANLLAEFKANGLKNEISEFAIEKNESGNWKVFYIVAPDGLCYWLGERIDINFERDY